MTRLPSNWLVCSASLLICFFQFVVSQAPVLYDFLAVDGVDLNGMTFDITSQTVYFTTGDSLLALPTSAFSNYSSFTRLNSDILSRSPHLGIATGQLAYDNSKSMFYVACTLPIEVLEINATVFNNATVGKALQLASAPQPQNRLGLWLDESLTQLWMADAVNHRILLYFLDGFTSGYSFYGTHGSGVGQFNGPVSVYRDPAAMGGALWVTDTGNHRVVSFNPDNMQATWVSFGDASYFYYPFGVVRDASGNVWVTDYSGNTVYSFSPKNMAATLRGYSYSGYPVHPYTMSPTNIAIDSTSNSTYDYVYVSNSEDVLGLWRLQVPKATVGVVNTPSSAIDFRGRGKAGNILIASMIVCTVLALQVRLM